MSCDKGFRRPGNMDDILKRLKPLKVKDATIEHAVHEFNKAIKKAYRKIERTGYPENLDSIAKTVIEKFWKQITVIYSKTRE